MSRYDAKTDAELMREAARAIEAMVILPGYRRWARNLATRLRLRASALDGSFK